MKRNRLIFAALIVGTCVFASFYGGAARTLFYLSLCIPFFSLLYTVYVYLRFRVYQNAEFKVIVKGEKTPYYFVLSNEDFLSYADVKVTFLDDFSTVQDMKLCDSYHLIPGEKIEKHTEILCRYRGEYNIGVKDVIVTDFLRLFSIRYPAPSSISMSVLPKIPELDTLSIAPVDSDAKLVKFMRTLNDGMPDCEMRKFNTGDSMKLVNWKVSAKKNELFVRQTSDTQNRGVVFVMDMSENMTDSYTRCITEDKVIESALATVNFLVKKHVPVTVVYEQGGEIMSDYICSPDSFKEFYEKCGALKFHGEITPSEVCGAVNVCNAGFVIMAVRELTEELCAVCDNILASDGEAAVLMINDSQCDLAEILDSRIVYRQIYLADEISDVLGGAYEHKKTAG